MALIDMVAEEIVKIPLESKDKPDVLRELVQILKDAGQINELEKLDKQLYNIEKHYVHRIIEQDPGMFGEYDVQVLRELYFKEEIIPPGTKGRPV